MEHLYTHAKVEMDGAVYSMKPTFAAISEIERNTGKGFFRLTKELQSGDFLFRDLVDIVASGVKHGGNGSYPCRDKIGECLAACGLEQAASAVAEFMSIAITGSKNEKL